MFKNEARLNPLETVAVYQPGPMYRHLSIALILSTLTGVLTMGHAMAAAINNPPEVVRQALDGSAEAALRLENQYSLTANHTEAIFWGMIAAENGSQIGAYNLAVTLAESPHADQRRRARFWLKKLIANGGERGMRAKSLLADLDERERTKKTGGTVLPERYPKW